MHNCIATFIIRRANAGLTCLLEIHLNLTRYVNAKKELKPQWLGQKSAIYLGELQLHNQCVFLSHMPPLGSLTPSPKCLSN